MDYKISHKMKKYITPGIYITDVEIHNTLLTASGGDLLPPIIDKGNGESGAVAESKFDFFSDRRIGNTGDDSFDDEMDNLW